MTRANIPEDLARAMEYVRRVVVIGMQSLCELERIERHCNPSTPAALRPTHPTGGDDTLSEFAEALRWIEALQRWPRTEGCEQSEADTKTVQPVPDALLLGSALRSIDRLVTHRALDLVALCEAAHDAVGSDGAADHRVKRLLGIARTVLNDLADDVSAAAEEVGCNQKFASDLLPPMP